MEENIRTMAQWRTEKMINALLGGNTCGLNCWLAEEDTCKCYCFGANHGILLKDGAKQPQRMAKIDGKFYYLFKVAVYKDIWKGAEDFNKKHGSYQRDYFGKKITYHIKDTEPNAPCRLKKASKTQLESWAELKGNWEKWNKPYLLWIREDLTEQFKTEVN